MVLFDFGRVIYAQNALTQAAREGARAGQGTATYTQAKYDAIRNAAQKMHAGVDVAGSAITGDSARGCAAAAAAAGTTGVNDSTSPSTCFYPKGVSAGQTVVVNIR